jgi:hypothetical protein
LELTLRRWNIFGTDAAAVLQISDDNAEFMVSEDAYLAVADQRIVWRGSLVLGIADALDSLPIHRLDQAKWIRRPFPPAVGRTPLMLMKCRDSDLKWFVAFLR